MAKAMPFNVCSYSSLIYCLLLYSSTVYLSSPHSFTQWNPRSSSG